MTSGTRGGWLRIGTAVFVAALALRFAFLGLERQRSAQVELRALEAGNQRLRDRLSRLTERPEPADTPGRRRSSSASDGRYIMRSSEQEAKPAVPQRRFDSPVDFFAAHPKFEDLYLSLVRSQVASEYGPLFRSLGLPAEKAELFEDLMTRHAESLADLVAAARDQELSEDDDAVKPVREQADANLFGGLAALLGPTGFDAFQRYQSTRFGRAQANQLAGMLFATGSPLTAEQADGLSQTLSDRLGQPAMRQNLLVMEPAADFAGALAAAQSILSPSQYSVFQTELEAFQLRTETAELQLQKP